MKVAVLGVAGSELRIVNEEFHVVNGVSTHCSYKSYNPRSVDRSGIRRGRNYGLGERKLRVEMQWLDYMTSSESDRRTGQSCQESPVDKQGDGNDAEAAV